MLNAKRNARTDITGRIVTRDVTAGLKVLAIAIPGSVIASEDTPEKDVVCRAEAVTMAKAVKKRACK